MLMLILFAFHIIWLLATSDMERGLKDVRIKLPLLFLPLVIGTLGISKKQLRIVFYALAMGIWVATLVGYITYFTSKSPILDPREIVFEISHIRLSLCIVILFPAVFYYWRDFGIGLKVIAALTLVNALVFLNLLQSATGVLLLGILIFYSLMYFSARRFGRWAYLGIGVLSLVVLFFSIQFTDAYFSEHFTSKEDLDNLPQETAAGEPYKHYTENLVVENGRYIYLNIAPKELRQAWDERSDFTLAENQDEHPELYPNILRYITSKGLKKDRAGVYALSEADIRNIESGIPSVLYVQKKGIPLRFHTFLFGLHVFETTGSASGYSFFQRLIFWKVGTAIAKENFLLGVGTGDVQTAFDEMYTRLDPDIKEEFRLRGHNQFLTFLISFGLPGLILFASIFLLYFYKSRGNYLVVAVGIAVLASCLTEDTLETQAGVTFFSFFLAILSSLDNCLD
jgi:hypothetical protein